LPPESWQVFTAGQMFMRLT